MQKKHIYFIDYLRVIAVVSVIFSHIIANTNSYYDINIYNSNMFFLYDLLLNLSLIAVPIFLMITGYLLLDEERYFSFNKMFKCYFLKCMLIIIIFGTSFNCIEAIFNTHSFNIESIFKSFIDAVGGKSWNHMWYMYMLLVMYLLIPIFRKLVKNLDDKEYIYLLLLILLFNICFKLSKLTEWTTEYFPIKGIYIFYLLIGDFIRRYKKEIVIKYKKIYILIGILIVGICSIVKDIYHIEFLQNFLAYDGLFLAILAITIFLVFVEKGDDIKCNKLISSISNASFGIYIIHMFFVNIIVKFTKINFYKWGIMSLFTFMLEFILIFTITYGVTLILKKIPITNKLL